MTEDLAASIARQSVELWFHVPAGEQPGDDDELLIRTDSAGNLMVLHGETVFMLREGRGWRHRPVPLGEEVTEFLGGTQIAQVVVSRPRLN